MVITYIYDPLYRLTAADYSTGEFYHYTYDETGNRLTEETQLESHDYVYDVANRLSSVDAVPYTFDDNGNLLGDGINTYSYDSANRLTSDGTVTYSYNGLGDRYQQTIASQTTTYVLDLNSGLTQVLEDGDNTYLYGLGRIAQINTETDYFMGDALGSVRQLVEGGEIVLAKSYAPYGEDLYSTGSGASAFAYTGEQTDPNGLVYLRARYYGPSDGRFLSKDTWEGNYSSPQSLNLWNYTQSNPINYTDPTGNYCIAGFDIGTAGTKCTEEQKQRAIQVFETLRWYMNAQTNFKLGFTYELLDSVLVLGPETQRALWELIRNTEFGRSIESTTALGIALSNLFCNVDSMQDLPAMKIAEAMDNALLNMRGDPFFIKGRVLGRGTALLMAGAELFAGISTKITSKPVQALALAMGPVTGGGSASIAISIEVVNTALLVHGGLVIAAVGIKEWNDHLLYNAITGNEGGGGGGNQWRPLGVNDLPSSYKPPKGGPRKVVVNYGPYRGRYGWLDEKGNIWVASKPGESHGGPHWDVQIDGGRGGNINVYP